jgi:drug/metabolite transporter (DMT)-like permease
MHARIGTSVPALIAALVTVVLWASAFVGIRAVAGDFGPGALALGRQAVGTLGLGAMVAVRGWVRPSARDLALMAAAGLLWFALYNVALNAAERNLDAGTAAMIVGLGPIFIAVLAGMFLHEGLPRRVVAGCLVAFAGTAVIGLATSAAPAPGANPALGVGLCVACAVAFASGVTLQKPVVTRIPALQVTFMGCLVGALVCLPFAPELVSEIAATAPERSAWIVYLGLFPTAIGFTTWAFALRRTTAGRMGSTTYLVPPVVIAMAWLLLGEVPAPAVFGGGALCIAGVIVARSRWSAPGRRAALPGTSGPRTGWVPPLPDPADR